MTADSVLDTMEKELSEKRDALERQVEWLAQHDFGMEVKACGYKHAAYGEALSIIRRLKRELETERKYPLREVEIIWDFEKNEESACK